MYPLHDYHPLILFTCLNLLNENTICMYLKKDKKINEYNESASVEEVFMSTIIRLVICQLPPLQASLLVNNLYIIASLSLSVRKPKTLNAFSLNLSIYYSIGMTVNFIH